MGFILNLWHTVSNSGNTKELSLSSAKRIILTNRFGIISVVFTFPYIISYFFSGYNNVALFSLLICLVYFSIPVFNKFQQYTLAKLILYLGVLIHQFFLASSFGENAEIHIIYIALILLPIVLFEIKKQIGWIIFCIVITIFATLLLYQTNFSLFAYSVIPIAITNNINIAYKITTVVGCFVILFSSIMVAEKTEFFLNETNFLLQQQLQAIFDNSFDALFLVNWKERKIIKANKRAVELFEAEEESDFYGLYGLEFHKSPKEKVNYEEMRKSLKENKAFEEEVLYKTFKGNEFWGNLVIRIIYISGMPYQSIRVTDITNQKNTKKQIQDSLHEKEILLSEIHHRVKNNLAVISGLLGLQSSYVEDEKAKALFEDSRNRIHSMALIHDKLYQHETFAKIEFCAYINDLINHIKSSYFSKQTKINFTVTCNDIFLDIKTAIPCGLILNELITNACKHAFSDRTEGEINIVCSKMGGNFTLMVSDNGVGYDGGEALKKSNSLGLTLINALSEQINARIKTTHHNGTAYYISIEV